MRSLPTVMFAMFLLFCSAACFSQTPPGVQHGAPVDPDHELAQMAARYKLDSTQKAEIKPILESRQEDLKLIASDSSLSPEQRGERLQDLHDSQITLFDRDQK
jgi:hypothetical protein